jgi:phosphate/sulfate permease
VRWGTPRRMVIAWLRTLPGAGTVGAVAYSVAQFAGF